MSKLSELMTSELMHKLIFFVIVLVVALIVQRVLVRLTKKALDASEVPSASIFINILRAVIWAFALLAILQPVFGIEPTGFVTTLGVASVAISLGLQTTISNLIGGLFLLIGHVIEPGDYIEVSDITGTVKDINLRSTTVVDTSGNTEVIPNSVLNSSSLSKITPKNFNAAKVALYVHADQDLNAIEEQVIQAGRDVLGDRLDPANEPIVRFGGVPAVNGALMTFYFYLKDGENTFDAVDDVMRAISGRPWLQV